VSVNEIEALFCWPIISIQDSDECARNERVAQCRLGQERQRGETDEIFVLDNVYRFAILDPFVDQAECVSFPNFRSYVAQHDPNRLKNP